MPRSSEQGWEDAPKRAPNVFDQFDEHEEFEFRHRLEQEHAAGKRADLEQLYTALRNADKAGDTKAAKRLAEHIQSLSSEHGWEDAPGKPNVFDQFDRPKRTPPTKLKIGREGFADAMRAVLTDPSQEIPKSVPLVGGVNVGGRAAAFGSYPRQLYEGAKQRLGIADPTAIEATRAMEETYPLSALGGGVATAALASRIPGATSLAGQGAFGGATGFLTPTEEGGSAGKNALLGFLTSFGTAGALKGAGMVTKSLLSRSASKAAQAAEEHAVRDATLTEARQAGYVVPKSATGESSALEKFVESTAGRGSLNREASKRNQVVTNRIAAKEAGLPSVSHLTEDGLEAARERLAQPYKDVADMSPKAAKALREMKDARAQAKAYHREYDKQQTVASLEKAKKFDAQADRAEKTIEQEALKLAHGQGAAAKATVQALRDARIALAKNYDVERALVPGSGNVDAHKIGQLLKQRGPKAMTGGLGTIGRFAKTFPDFAREKPSGQISAAVSAVRPYATAGALALGAQDERAHRFGVSPYMLALAGLSAAGGPARSLALRQVGMAAPTYAPSMTLRLADLAARQGQRLLPMTTAGLALQPNDK